MLGIECTSDATLMHSRFCFISRCGDCAMYFYFSAELQQIGLAPNQSKSLEKRVVVTDGTEFPLTGMCVYFVRPNNTRPISTSNIAEVSHGSYSLSSA